MKKRGQITAFIVIGFVILLSAAVLFYAADVNLPSITIVKPEFLPVKSYVEACMANLASDAVFLASMQGGYVQVPIEIAENPDSYVNAGFKIPYWLYNSQDRMPTKANIEEQIAEHITNELGLCLNNFSDFSDFVISSEGGISTKVSIRTKDVMVKTEFPLKVEKKQGPKTSLKDFTATVTDNFGEKYELAKSIMEAENQAAFLEDLTMEMIAASAFPNEGMELVCGKREYHIDNDIKPALKMMLIANFHYLTFENTNYIMPQNPYFQNNYVFRVSDKDYLSMRVETIFNRDWPVQLDITPNNNRIVKPVNFDIPVISSCIKIYNHKYDIIYPLMFRITDYSFNSSSYFYFATPVVIDDSLPSRHTYVHGPLIVDTIGSSEYCDEKDYVVRVFAIDEFTGDKLGDVDIDYQCVRFLCDMGTTSLATSNGLIIDPTYYLLETDFPACAGGLVIGEKQGYQKFVSQPIYTGLLTMDGETKVHQDFSVNLVMTPLKALDFDIRVAEYSGTSFIEKPLEEGESALITLKNEEKLFDESYLYPESSNITLMLGDYTYLTDIKLVKNETWVGGFAANVTFNGYSVNSANGVTFYALKNAVDPVTEEESFALIEMINSKSGMHPPKTR